MAGNLSGFCPTSIKNSPHNGHSNPNSIQSYLDEASRYRKDESIFHEAEAEKVDAEVPENGHKSGHFIPVNPAEARTGI